MKRRTYLTILWAVWAAIQLPWAAVACAGDWPGWRGPTGCGTTDEKDLALKWDGKTGEGVVWKASLSGTLGHSSPVVWGDRVFITSFPRQSPEQEQKKEIPDPQFDCFRASDGKLLWRTRVAHGPLLAYLGAYCAPTPVTDGKAVYGMFGSGVAAAVDFDGKLLWRCELTDGFTANPPLFNPTICTSPVLYKDTVIVLLDQGGGGVLQARDKHTGEVKWVQKRDKDQCAQCNTTPLLIDVQGKTQLVILGSKVLQSFNPADGRLLWWCISAHGFAASPLYSSGLIYADLGDDQSAVAIDPTGKGNVTATHVKWKVSGVKGQWGSAVADGKYIYRVDDTGRLTCRDLATGKAVYAERLKDVSTLASPVATADGRIYFATTGKSYAIKAGSKFEVIGGGHVGGWDLGSSPAVSNGRLFVRDGADLYCIGKKSLAVQRPERRGCRSQSGSRPSTRRPMTSRPRRANRGRRHRQGVFPRA